MRQRIFIILASIAILFHLTVPSSGGPHLRKSAASFVDRPFNSAFISLVSTGTTTAIDRMCLALALYHEARGEPLEGQKAVGITILNRVASKAYPSTICDVVFQNSHRLNACQFSFACDSRANTPGNPAKFAQMIRISEDIIASLQPGNGTVETSMQADNPVPSRYLFATHYHRHDVSPSWSKKLRFIARVGDHHFFKSDRVVRKISQTGLNKRADILCSDICNYLTKLGQLH